MSVIKLMQNTVQPLRRARLLKLILIACSVSLSACSKTYVTPNIPPPATDLMQPAPPGSKVLDSASKNMGAWLEMLQNGQTKRTVYRITLEVLQGSASSAILVLTY